MTGIRTNGPPRMDERLNEAQPSVGRESWEQAREQYSNTSVYDVESGSVTQGIAGGAAVVLGIVGLIGLARSALASVARMAAVFAVLGGGAAIAARYRRLMSGGSTRRGREEVAGGMGLAAFAGLGGVVLGVLALLAVNSTALLGVSSIVLGGALIMMSAAAARLEAAWRMRERELQRGTDTMYMASGGEFLIGAGAVVLGILSLSGIAPVTLAAVAMLSVGVAALASGSSVAGRVFSLFG